MAIYFFDFYNVGIWTTNLVDRKNCENIVKKLLLFVKKLWKISKKLNKNIWKNAKKLWKKLEKIAKNFRKKCEKIWIKLRKTRPKKGALYLKIIFRCTSDVSFDSSIVSLKECVEDPAQALKIDRQMLTTVRVFRFLRFVNWKCLDYLNHFFIISIFVVQCLKP